MTMIRNAKSPVVSRSGRFLGRPGTGPGAREPYGPSLEQAVRAWRETVCSQRAIARELRVDRRKVRKVTDPAV